MAAPGEASPRGKEAAAAPSGFALRASDEETLRRRFPAAQVQLWPLVECPLLLSRLAEDWGHRVPDAQELLHGDQQAATELLLCVEGVVRAIEGAPPARAPEKPRLHSLAARDAALEFPPSLHVPDAKGAPWRDRRAAAHAARSRRFARPWWRGWSKGLERLRLDLRSATCSATAEAVRRDLVNAARVRITQGYMPSELRPALWTWLAPRGVAAGLDPARYHDLLRIPWCRTKAEEEVEREVKRQVERDLERTPPALFVGGGGSTSSCCTSPSAAARKVVDVEAVAAARSRVAERLLVAFSRHRPDIGYCQGLNLIVALLLAVLDEHSAFVVLCGLVDRLPTDLYSCDPERLAYCRSAEQDRVRSALAAERPVLAEHLELLDLDLNLFLPRWLTCLFASVLPVPATLRLWDYVLADGGDVPPRLAVAMLAQAEEQLLGASDMQEALEVLASIVDTVGPGDVDTMLRREWSAKRFEHALAEDGEAEDTEGEADDYGDIADSVVKRVDSLEDASTEASTFIGLDDSVASMDGDMVERIDAAMGVVARVTAASSP